jgi:hypothetical protein
MKKLLLIASVAVCAYACNDGSKSSTTTTDTAAAAPAVTAPAVDSSAAKTTDSTATLKDGLITLKDGKVLTVKGGVWVPLEAAVTTTNGRKVSPNGEISKGDKKRKLEEGWVIDPDGQIKDKNGKLLDTSGWD